MPINYDALATFRATQPDDATCLAASVERVSKGASVKIPIADVQLYMGATMAAAATGNTVLGTIIAAQGGAAGAGAPQIVAAQAIFYLQSAALPIFEFGSNVVETLLGQLVGTGILLQADADAARDYFAKCYRWELAGIGAAPTQADLDQLPIIAKWQYLVGTLNNAEAAAQAGLNNALAGSTTPAPTAASLVGG